MDGEISEPQGREHEHDGNGRRHLPEQGAGTGAAEERLARTAEGRPHAGPFATLEQHDDDQKDTNLSLIHI